MVKSRTQIVAGVLYGSVGEECDGASLFFASIVDLLVKNEEVPYEELFKLICLSCYIQYTEIAKAVKAVALADEKTAVKWFALLSSLFEEDYKPSFMSSNICLGVVMGLFESATVLGRGSWPDDSGCKEEFANIVVKIMLNSNLLLRVDLFSVNTPYFTHDERESKKRRDKIMGHLSSAIRGFIEVSEPYAYKRKREAVAIMEEAFEQLKKRSEKRLKKIGTLVAEQLSFAIFSKMTAKERIEAIALACGD